MAQRYSVVTVLADGNPVEVFVTYSPLLALRKVEAQRERYKTYGNHQYHCVVDPDDGEKGEFSMSVLEELSEELCPDCGYFDPENRCRFRSLS